MRRILVAAVVLVACSLPVAAVADAPPPSSAGAAAAVRYPTLAKMIHRFKQQADARARAQVVAQR
jgi:hypothetical protein